MALSDRSAAPDGGWGWVIVFCSHVIHLLTVGVIFSLSVLYVDWLEEFQAGRSLTSWVISVSIATTYMIGPLPAYLASKFGYRKVVVVGGILSSTGYLLAFSSQNIYMLIVAIGLVTGCGNGISFLPAVATVASWFDKRRPLAIGIGRAGVGIGSFVCAPSVHWLIEQFGWRGTLMVLAGIELNLCVVGCLLRPVPEINDVLNSGKDTNDDSYNEKVEVGVARIKREEEDEKGREMILLKETGGTVSRQRLGVGVKDSRICDSLEHLESAKDTSSVCQQFSSLRELPTEADVHPVDNVQKILKNGSDHKLFNICGDFTYPSGSNKSLHSTYVPVSLKENISHDKNFSKTELTADKRSYDLKEERLGKYESDTTFNDEKDSCDHSHNIKWTLLKDRAFVTFLICNIFTNLAYLTPVLFMVDRAKYYGIAQTSAAMLVSINGIGNVFGRIVLPTICDWFFSDRLVSFIVCMSVCGLATALSVLCESSFILHSIHAAVYGSTIGMHATQMAVVTVELVGVDIVGHALGCMLMFMGVASLVGPPFAGWIFDVTGDYVTAFIINGFFLLASSLLLVPVAICRRRRRKS